MHTPRKKTSFIRRLPLVGIFAFSVAGLSAQADELSLKEAVEQAWATNHQLQARTLEAGAASARVGAADALPDPKAQFAYFGESVETRTGPQEAIYSISQTIPWLEKLDQRKNRASDHADSKVFLTQVAKRQLKEAVVRSYSQAAYLRKAVESSEKNLGWIQETQEIVDEQVRAGASLNGLLRLEVELELTRDNLEQQQQELLVERAKLAALLARDESSLAKLVKAAEPSKLELPTIETLFEKLDRSNPELQALRSLRAGSEAETRLSELERYPDFTFGLNYIQVGGNSSASRDAGRAPWNVSVAITLPIWGGKTRAGILAARSSERATEQTYRQRHEELKAELSSALARHTDNARRLRRYRDTLMPLAEQALENSQAAYASGEISVLEVIDSERALLDLELTYWRTVAQLYQNRARIEALTGHSTLPM